MVNDGTTVAMTDETVIFASYFVLPQLFKERAAGVSSRDLAVGAYPPMKGLTCYFVELKPSAEPFMKRAASLPPAFALILWLTAVRTVHRDNRGHGFPSLSPQLSRQAMLPQ